jgi:beta-galactosidase
MIQRPPGSGRAAEHDQLMSNPKFAGGIGWSAFDYNTHAGFGSGDRICYHGISDIFREPKPAAGFYRSQCDPSEEVVLAPAFHWSRGDVNQAFSNGVICSSCDKLKVYIDGAFALEAEPVRAQFAHLKYPPFTVDLEKHLQHWGDMRIEGYIAGKLAISRTFSGKDVDQKFLLLPDDTELVADGADTTRVVLRGPAVIIGDNPMALVGGIGDLDSRYRTVWKGHPYCASPASRRADG